MGGGAGNLAAVIASSLFSARKMHCKRYLSRILRMPYCPERGPESI